MPLWYDDAPFGRPSVQRVTDREHTEPSHLERVLDDERVNETPIERADLVLGRVEADDLHAAREPAVLESARPQQPPAYRPFRLRQPLRAAPSGVLRFAPALRVTEAKPGGGGLIGLI